MDKRIFKNYYFLNFQDKAIEEKFQIFTNRIIIKYSIWFSVYGLIISLFETLIHSQLNEKMSNLPDHKYHNITNIFSYTASGVLTIQCFLHFFLRRETIQKILVYFNYITVISPLLNLRQVLFNQKLIEGYLHSMIRIFDTVDRIIIILVLTFCFHVPNSYIINIISLGSISIYSKFLGSNTSIISCLGNSILLTAISYLYKRQVKITFFINSKLKKQNDCYSNILEHFKCGLMVFNEKKIKFINKYFKDIINRFREDKFSKIERGMKHRENLGKNDNTNISEKNETCFENGRKIPIGTPEKYLIEDGWEKINLYEEINSENIYSDDSYTKKEILDQLDPEEILKNLLCDIKKHNNLLNTLSFLQKNREDFNFKENLSEMQSFYKESNMRGKFIKLGYKELVLDSCTNPSTVNENLTFEVYFRCYLIENKLNILNRNYSNLSDFNEEEFNFEIIFHDVSGVKNEQSIQNVNSNSLFFSKISHEFKNPLISISEIAENIIQDKECTDETRIQTKDFSYFHANQIKSITNYLLILIEDIKYFSGNYIGIQPDFKRNKTDLNDIIYFCQEMGEVLLNRYDKKDVIFSIIDQNFKQNFKFYTDVIKLKQILLNLISNSVKFTNLGKIEVMVNLSQEVIQTPHKFVSNEFIDFQSEPHLEEVLEFQIHDSGIGISEGKISEIMDNISFKSSPVCDIFKQYNSELKVKSKYGEGSTFSFKIKIEKAIQVESMKKLDETIEIYSKNKINYNSMLSGAHKFSKCIFTNSQKTNKDQLIMENNSKELFIQELKTEITPIDTLEDPSYLESLDKTTKIILLVDDEKMTRKSSKRILKKSLSKLREQHENNFNFHVVELEDGIDCLYFIYKLLKKGVIKIFVISDENMKYMNGSTCAQTIKNLKNLNCDKIPFISLTAYDEMNCKYVDYFVSKPLVELEADKILYKFAST